MKAIHKILVPVDFSNNAKASLRYAYSLARNMSARLTVLHVFNKEPLEYRDAAADFIAVLRGGPESAVPRPSLPTDRWLEDKMLDLHNFIQAVIKDSGQGMIKKRVEIGNPTNNTLRVARQEQADLVVFALRQRPLVWQLFEYSKLLKIMFRLPCSSLLVGPTQTHPDVAAPIEQLLLRTQP